MGILKTDDLKVGTQLVRCFRHECRQESRRCGGNSIDYVVMQKDCVFQRYIPSGQMEILVSLLGLTGLSLTFPNLAYSLSVFSYLGVSLVKLNFAVGRIRRIRFGL